MPLLEELAQPEGLVGRLDLDPFPQAPSDALALERAPVGQQPLLQRVAIGLLLALDGRQPARLARRHERRSAAGCG